MISLKYRGNLNVFINIIPSLATLVMLHLHITFAFAFALSVAKPWPIWMPDFNSQKSASLLKLLKFEQLKKNINKLEPSSKTNFWWRKTAKCLTIEVKAKLLPVLLLASRGLWPVIKHCNNHKVNIKNDKLTLLLVSLQYLKVTVKPFNAATIAKLGKAWKQCSGF